MDPECAPWTFPVAGTAIPAAAGNSVSNLGDYSTRPVADLDNTVFDMRFEPGGPNDCGAPFVASSKAEALPVQDEFTNTHCELLTPASRNDGLLPRKDHFRVCHPKFCAFVGGIEDADLIANQIKGPIATL